MQSQWLVVMALLLVTAGCGTVKDLLVGVEELTPEEIAAVGDQAKSGIEALVAGAAKVTALVAAGLAWLEARKARRRAGELLGGVAELKNGTSTTSS